MKQFSIIYPKNFTSFLKSLHDRPESLEILEIKHCPSIDDAFQLISHKCFKEKIKRTKIIAIVLKIDEIFPIKYTASFSMQEVSAKNILFVSFESSINDKQMIFYWKNLQSADFLNMNLLHGHSTKLTSFIKEMLLECIHNGFIGLEAQFMTLYPKVTDLYDIKGHNLLMRATEQGNLEIVKELLKFSFDINEVNVTSNKKSVDIAYEKENFEIFYELLQANSPFPRDFYADEASQSIQEFIRRSAKIHQAIFENNQTVVTEIIDTNPNIRHFYNLKNESAATTALKLKRMKIYNLLTKSNVCVGPEEDINEIFDVINHCEEPKEKVRKIAIQMRSIHDRNAKILDNNHLMILIANSFTGHDNQQSSMQTKIIQEVYEFLNKFPQIRPILMVVATSKNFKINFDFNRSTTAFIDPTNLGVDQENGTCYFMNGQLYVAAKELLYEGRKYETMGVIAHELCHYALYLAFRNSCKPYAVDDIRSENLMNQMLDKYQTNSFNSNLMNNIYAYEKEYQISELTVRVPQMLIHYHNNPQTLCEITKEFIELFTYFEENVVPKLTESIEMLELIKSNRISWKELTEAGRSKILYSVIVFQGIEVKLNEIIDHENMNILNCLNSEQICKLMDDQSFEISKPEQNGLEFYIERKFENKKTMEKVDFNEIIENSNIHNILLLSDQAGSGKTTTFKSISRKLKIKGFSKDWISYIDLKRYTLIYKKYKSSEWNHKSIIEILSDIFKLPDELEKRIFTYLFMNKRVILFWDGVDEISPYYKNFIVNLMLKIRQISYNKQWISTRPQHAEFLEIVFQCAAYKFIDYDKFDKINFIKEYLHVSLEKDCRNVTPITNERVLNFLESIENVFHSISNPLILKMIVELYASQPESSVELNIYKIYEMILDKKKELLYTKGEISNYDRDVKSNLNIWQVHQIYALILIFRTGFADVTSAQSLFVDLNNFTIMKKWKRQQHKWTPEIISRYGFLIVDNWMSVDEWGISWEFSDFIHRTFAEFFIAQFIIENIYEEDDEEVQESEMENRLKLLYCIFYNNDYSQIKQFASSFIDLQIKNGSKNFLEIVQTLASKKAAHKVFSSKFFIQSYEILKSIWQLDGSCKNTLFQDLQNDDSTSFKYLLDVVNVAEKIFPTDWLRITGYSSKNSCSSFEDFHLYKENQRNLVILSKFMEENYPIEIECQFLKKYFNEMFFQNFMDCRMLERELNRIRIIFKDDKLKIMEIIISVIKNPYNFLIYQDENLINLLWKEVEDIFNPEEMKQILFHEYQPYEHPLLTIFRVKSINIMNFYLNYYRKYSTVSELKNFFLSSNKEFFWLQIASISNEKVKYFTEFLSEIFVYVKNDENLKLLKIFFTQRDASGHTLLSYMNEKVSVSMKNSEDEIKFKDVKNLACKVLDDEEIRKIMMKS